jgi:hypothetical protein
MTLPIVVVVIAALAVGCGGGDDSTSTSTAGSSASETNTSASSDSTPNSSSNSGSAAQAGATVTTSTLSKAEFIRQATAACNEEREGLVDEVTNYLSKQESKELPESVSLVNMARSVMLPTIEAEMAAVRGLGAPAGDEEEVEAMIGATLAAVDEVKELKKAKSLEEIENHFAGATQMFQDYGFEACINSL